MSARLVLVGEPVLQIQHAIEIVRVGEVTRGKAIFSSQILIEASSNLAKIRKVWLDEGEVTGPIRRRKILQQSKRCRIEGSSRNMRGIRVAPIGGVGVTLAGVRGIRCQRWIGDT